MIQNDRDIIKRRKDRKISREREREREREWLTETAKEIKIISERK